MQKKTHTQSNVYINHEARHSNDILRLAQNNNTRSFIITNNVDLFDLQTIGFANITRLHRLTLTTG